MREFECHCREGAGLVVGAALSCVVFAASCVSSFVAAEIAVATAPAAFAAA